VIENTIETENRSEHLKKATDAVGATLGAAGEFLSRRVLSSMNAGASRLAPTVETAKNCATRTAQSGKDAVLKVGGKAKDLALRAGGLAKDALSDGIAVGHRTARKVL